MSDVAIPVAGKARWVFRRSTIDQHAVDGPRALGSVALPLVICMTAICARWIVFGNPLVHIDEEFYLLVGNRMLHGAVPYVDIWDRKPVGLFLIFAGARWLGGDGVIQYQILALIFVCATALILFAMARRVAGPLGGLLSALLYIVYLDLAGGEAGQAPVWYNLPVAGAMAIIFFARRSDRTRLGDFRLPGAAAMLLFGIALQIKYSAVFEGMFAGVAMLAIGSRRGRALRALTADATLWIGCALLPTVAAGGVYAGMGHFHDWLFANFVSITERGVELPVTVRWRLAELAMILGPLVAAVPLRRWCGATSRAPEVREDLRFLDAWAGCSLLGLLVFGTWFNHYALPTFAPLAVTAAPLARCRWGRIYAGTLLACAAVWGQHILHRHELTRGDRALLAEVTAAMRDHRNCLFVYDGLVAAYDTAHSCLPTTHVFPTHFAGRIEQGATGIDEAALVRTIMARRPDRVTSMEPAYPGENLAVRAIFYRDLRRYYAEIDRVPRWDRQIVVYGLKNASKHEERRSTLLEERQAHVVPMGMMPRRSAEPDS